MTEKDFKILKREKLMIASLVDAINFKHNAEIKFVMNETYVQVYQIINGVFNLDLSVHALNKFVVSDSLIELNRIKTKLEHILKTGEV